MSNANGEYGIKHDASSIMELELIDGRFLNKLGEECVAESSHLFPFLKSSDLANGRTATNRFVVVPQFRTNEDTLRLKDTAPKLWASRRPPDLLWNEKELDLQKSSQVLNFRCRALHLCALESRSSWFV